MKTFPGFCYQTGKPLALTGPEWRAKFKAIADSGGSRRLIGDRGDIKDPTAFDAKGRMLFELHQETAP